MDDLTLRDAIRESLGYIHECIELEVALEDAGFDLDATAEEVADGRAWGNAQSTSAYLRVETFEGLDAVTVIRDWKTAAKPRRSGHGPTLAAAVAALEEGAGDE